MRPVASGAGLSRRNSYGGFKHDTYGTVVVGRHDTPGKIVGRKADLFWSTQLGQNRSFTNLRDGSGAGPGFDLRSDNTIGYISPNWGPFHIFGAYIADHKTCARLVQPDCKLRTAAAPVRSGSPTTTISRLTALQASMNRKTCSRVMMICMSASATRLTKSAFDPALPHSGIKRQRRLPLRVGATYGIANWTLAFFFQNATDQGFIDGADRNQAGGGLSYKVGQNTFKGQIYWLDELDDTTALGSGTDTGGFLYSIGWDHAFSKNVQFYVQGAALSADKCVGGGTGTAAATCGSAPALRLGGSGHGDSALATPDETTFGGRISVGSRIKF